MFQGLSLFAHFLAVSLCSFSYLLQVEGSLMVAEQGTVLWLQQNATRSHFIDISLYQQCFFPRSMTYLVSGSWPYEQCQVPSHRAILKSSRILAGCATVSPVHPVGTIPGTGDFIRWQEMSSLGYLVIPFRFFWLKQWRAEKTKRENPTSDSPQVYCVIYWH